MSDQVKIGDRAWCIDHHDGDGPFYVFGIGTVVSFEIPVGGCGMKSHLAIYGESKVPKIDLGNGKFVWGTECTMSEDKREEDVIREKYGVKIIDIDAMREKWNENNLPVTFDDIMNFLIKDVLPGISVVKIASNPE